MTSYTRILQLSDIHLFANPEKTLLGIKTNENLALIINMIKQDSFKPDLIILSGDLSQDGSDESYQHLVAAFHDIKVPIYWVAGNHDNLAVMTQSLQDKFNSEKSILTATGWQIILLNSAQIGKVWGYLTEKELQYLYECLDKPNYKYAMIVMHHQPVPVGSNWLDALGLTNADELLKIIPKYLRIKALVYGHVHQEYSIEQQGIHFIATPATAIQFLPRSNDFALDTVNFPGYRCFELYDNGEIRTWVKRLSHYAGGYDLTAKGY